jgi:CO/xanthine dehydrogenase FAD-binding subunit
MNFELVSPETTEDLLRAIDENQDKRLRFGAGYTDLILDLWKEAGRELTVINLARLNDPAFTSIEAQVQGGGVRIGALVTASRIIGDKELNIRYPVLPSAALQHASRQIRQVATIGGNVCTASPAGDMACALVALQAQCDILTPGRETRVVPINDFFVGVRETGLESNEVLRGVVIPPGDGGRKIHSGFIKVGTRRSMECAIVSIAYHVEIDDDDTIAHAGVAVGSVAPTIKYAGSACEYVVGRKFAEMGGSECETFASKVLEYASPISDIRASAWYREDVLYNMSKSIFENR